MIKKLFIILILNFIYSSFAFSENKIAFVDLDIVIKKSDPGKIILKNLNDISEKNIKQLKSMQNELQSEEKKIQSKKNILSNEDFNKEVSSLKNKISEYRKIKDNKSNEFNKLKNEEVSSFFNKVNPIIQNYMDDNSIELLLDRKNVFIGKVTSDITNDIIELINRNYK